MLFMQRAACPRRKGCYKSCKIIWKASQRKNAHYSKLNVIIGNQFLCIAGRLAANVQRRITIRALAREYRSIIDFRKQQSCHDIRGQGPVAHEPSVAQTKAVPRVTQCATKCSSVQSSHCITKSCSHTTRDTGARSKASLPATGPHLCGSVQLDRSRGACSVYSHTKIGAQ